MAQKKNNNTKASEPREEPWEQAAQEQTGGSYEDDQYGRPRMTLQGIADALCDVNRQVEDTVMAIVPPEVTQHVVNSQKELLAAGRRVNEMLNEKLDRYAARAREVHERKHPQAQQEPVIKPPE